MSGAEPYSGTVRMAGEKLVRFSRDMSRLMPRRRLLLIDSSWTVLLTIRARLFSS